MKFTKGCISAALGLGAFSAFASGFALYQASTVSHAMGNALVGKAMDASANFNNPATLTDLTNLQFTVGFVTEHPRGAVRVRENGGSFHDRTMDPGLFWLPHFQMAMPLPWGFSFGLGGSADYGLGTAYDNSWPMNWNSTETTVMSYVLNPNLAYKLGDWSVAAGLRWMYFSFEQYSRPYCAQQNVDFGPYGTRTVNFGQLGNHLDGDNGYSSLGWQIGTKYDILDNLSIGAVYKSAIDVTVKGDATTEPKYVNVDTWSKMAAGALGMTPQQMLAYQAARHTGDAEAELTLPQSVTAGINWDVTKTWHLGTAVSWTQWSEFDKLHFDLPGTDKDIRLNWQDTWRASVGCCWDFWEDWKWMVSYTYDMDCTSSDQESTMLPPADRHIAATGIAWNVWRGLELALSYSCIFMAGGDMHTSDVLGNSYDLETCWGYCHAAGFSITYRF